MSLKGKRDMSGPVSIMVLLGLFLVLVGVFVWVSLTPPKTLTDFAQAFGDIAGTVISSLAFVLLFLTVLQQQRGLSIQREDLQLTRQELQDTREELQRTADAQQEQVNIAQMAARLTATASLLDSATQELASFGMSGESTKKQAARGAVKRWRDELIGQRSELSEKVEPTSERTPIRLDDGSTDEEAS